MVGWEPIQILSFTPGWNEPEEGSTERTMGSFGSLGTIICGILNRSDLPVMEGGRKDGVGKIPTVGNHGTKDGTWNRRLRGSYRMMHPCGWHGRWERPVQEGGERGCEERSNDSRRLRDTDGGNSNGRVSRLGFPWALDCSRRNRGSSFHPGHDSYNI